MELANEGTNEEKLICSKKSVRTFKLRDRTVLLSHAGRGKPLDSGFGGGNALVSRLRRDPFALKSDFVFFGGEGGIRTHGELAPSAVFKTAALVPLCDLSWLTINIKQFTIN